MTDSTDPLTPLKQSASSMHEIFVEWINAGFTEDQALKLVVATMRIAFDAAVQDQEPPL